VIVKSLDFQFLLSVLKVEQNLEYHDEAPNLKYFVNIVCPQYTDLTLSNTDLIHINNTTVQLF